MGQPNPWTTLLLRIRRVQSTRRALASNVSDDAEITELRSELFRQKSLAANISDACRRHVTSIHAAALDSEEDRTPSGRSRPCRLDHYRARVAAYSAAYWGRVVETLLPAMLAHRRYVERVGSGTADRDAAAAAGRRRAAAWLDFPRALFNISRRRLPWTRRRRQRQRGPPSDDDYDDALVDFWMFLWGEVCCPRLRRRPSAATNTATMTMR